MTFTNFDLTQGPVETKTSTCEHCGQVTFVKSLLDVERCRCGRVMCLSCKDGAATCTLPPPYKLPDPFTPFSSFGA